MPYTPAIPLEELRCIPVPMEALVKHGLNPTQWVVLYILHFNLWDEYNAYQLHEKAPQGFPAEDLQDLVDQYYLLFKRVPGDHPKLSPPNFKVSPRFTDLLHMVKPAWLPSYSKEHVASGPDLVVHTGPELTNSLDKLEAFDELFSAYPTHMRVDGKIMSARSGDLDQMALAYGKYLSTKGAMSHEDIVKLVVWAKESNLLSMGLNKFIASREWLGLASLKESGLGGDFDNADTI